MCSLHAHSADFHSKAVSWPHRPAGTTKHDVLETLTTSRLTLFFKLCLIQQTQTSLLILHLWTLAKTHWAYNAWIKYFIHALTGCTRDTAATAILSTCIPECLGLKDSRMPAQFLSKQTHKYMSPWRTKISQHLNVITHLKIILRYITIITFTKMCSKTKTLKRFFSFFVYISRKLFINWILNAILFCVYSKN